MKLLLLLVLAFGAILLPLRVQGQTASANAPAVTQYDGQWEGYDGEWRHVSRQLVELAQAIPADKYGWRPAKGVRSVSEVLMHLALANLYLLSVTSPKFPYEDAWDDKETKVTSKAEVIAFLEKSLNAVKSAQAELKPGDLERKVKIEGKTVTVDGMFLRIIIHDNEHMGQLVDYARMNGIVPPWSK